MNGPIICETDMVARGAAIKVTGAAHIVGTQRDGVKAQRRRGHPEQDFQAQLVALLQIALPPEVQFFAVPNGGWRTRVEAAILQGQGVKPGVPDLIFIHGGRACGLELKAGNNGLSVDQIREHDRLRGAGMTIGIARTIDEAIGFLKTNNIPLRIKE